jgi:ABC-type sugar transport system ATPase subunit
MENDKILKIGNVSKSFSGVEVLSDIDFELRIGEVHAIVGENGAGKSTLIKILSGAYERDKGHITVRGVTVEHITPRKAQDLGIVTIYQERNLVPYLSVGENILIGNEPRGLMGIIQWNKLYTMAEEILESLHLSLTPQDTVANLGSAEQQAVEIAKALYKNAQIVIMDEPTASLTKAEIDNLFRIIRQLKRENVSVIYISHRLDEIFEIADRVTVLRDGVKVLEREIEAIDKDTLVKAMVGEELDFTHIEGRGIGEVLLKVEGIARSGAFEDIDLELHRGEIIGIAGMVGSGRTEVVQALSGIDPVDKGRIVFGGEEIQGQPLEEFIRKGICFVPENRDAHGLISSMSVAGNTTLASLHKVSRGPLLDLSSEKELAQRYTQSLDIQMKSIFQEVKYLSGGNRQKVMLAKWLCLGIEVFIMDEPTQGVDVGAREEIHRIMKHLLNEGKAVVMVSSDLDELMNMSHRIAVMNRGRIVACLTTSQTTREEVLSFAIGKSTTSFGKSGETRSDN